MVENKEYRSKMMSKIRSTGGKAETLLAKKLWHEGIRYFRNYPKLVGKPDIAIKNTKLLFLLMVSFGMGTTGKIRKKKTS